MAGMPGMGQHAGHAMSETASRDSTRKFLRMMVNHHQGLITMSDSARTKATRADTRKEAAKLDAEQAREQRQMAAMLRRTYADSARPTIMPSNQAMIDSLGRASGADYDRTFLRNVIAHHREALAMIDPMLAHLTPDVRQMAARMRADQTKEIAEYEQKLRAM